MKSYRLLILLISIICWSSAFGKGTDIKGKIINEQSGHPVPFADILFGGTKVGTKSDSLGTFHLHSDQDIKTIEISAIGFERKTFQLSQNQSQLVIFALKETTYHLTEVVVNPTENPAFPILRKAIARKKENDPNNFTSTSRIYNKIEIDLKNIQKPSSNKKIWKQFEVVFNHIDTLKSEGKTFLPVFLTETMSDYYHLTGSPDREKIIASKASGLSTGIIAEYTGMFHYDINPYSNFINFSDIGLVSPLNRSGLQYYRYELIDSTIVNGHKIYNLSFIPRHKQEPTFYGNLWIADTTFAITKIDWHISKGTNINFLNDLAVQREYSYNGEKWIPSSEYLYLDFNIKKTSNTKLPGIIGRRTTSYVNFQYNSPSLNNQKQQAAVSIASDALNKDDQYWKENRPMPLQHKEAEIYTMVDSVKKIPLFKTTAEYIRMFTLGYKEFGKFEFGPYYNIYAHNRIEGDRFRVGGRTTEKFDNKLRLNGFIAYGIKDDQFKYGSGVQYFFNADPRFMAEIQYEHDYKIIGQSSTSLMQNNLLSSILSRNSVTKFNMFSTARFSIKREWENDLTNEISFTSSKIGTGPFVPFTDNKGQTIDHLRYSELSLLARYAPGEYMIRGHFNQTSFGSNNPIASIQYTHGFKDLLGGDYNYSKIRADFFAFPTINPIGYTEYWLQAGKIWGDVPFPLLQIHDGNETYAFDPYSFNLMNYQEFASDTYCALMVEHHFQGYFLNKIPLIRLLKWREIAGFRLLEGQLSNNHEKEILFPSKLSGLSKTPYMEASVGIENILKIIRVDGVWRLNYHTPDSKRFLLLLSLQFIL